MKLGAMLLATLAFLIPWPGAAEASCAYQTYVINGRMITCMTCCYGTQCTTNCNG